MNGFTDPFTHILKEISLRLSDERYARFATKKKKINACRVCSDKMLGYYYNWENNMNTAQEGARSMDAYKKHFPVNDDLQEAMMAFNKTINQGREKMGEAKRSWGGKCKKVYKELEVKNHGHERALENIISSAATMSRGLVEIAGIAKESYQNTREACLHVFSRYNAAVKSASAKNRRKISCGRISVTSKKIEAHVGQLPRQ